MDDNNCTTGCRTKDHATYGQCLSSNKPGVTGVNVTRDVSAGMKWETEIKEYRTARAQGIQPRSTQLKDIRSAVSRSNRNDTAVKDI